MMAWIIGAAVLNTIWTIWCVQLLPPRVATHFGLSGQANGWMSRKGFAWYGILFPLAMSAFIVTIGKSAGSSQALPTEMVRMSAGFTLFFSFLSWCLVRSNRRNPPRIDYPSLAVSICVLLVFVSMFVGGISKASGQKNQTGSAPNSSQN